MDKNSLQRSVLIRVMAMSKAPMSSPRTYKANAKSTHHSIANEHAIAALANLDEFESCFVCAVGLGSAVIAVGRCAGVQPAAEAVVVRDLRSSGLGLEHQLLAHSSLSSLLHAASYVQGSTCALHRMCFALGHQVDSRRVFETLVVSIVPDDSSMPRCRGARVLSLSCAHTVGKPSSMCGLPEPTCTLYS
jgi:hypothetical protein